MRHARHVLLGKASIVPICNMLAIIIMTRQPLDLECLPELLTIAFVAQTLLAQLVPAQAWRHFTKSVVPLLVSVEPSHVYLS